MTRASRAMVEKNLDLFAAIELPDVAKRGSDVSE